MTLQTSTHFSFFEVSHKALKVFSLKGDPPGAADVSCNAQEIKMRPGKSECSGLMNPCRGAAVGMDYYHEVPAHQHADTHKRTSAAEALSNFNGPSSRINTTASRCVSA